MNIKKIVSSLVLFSLVLFGGNALASSPKDFGLKEGDLIRATNDNDIFIINEFGYKRLFLNPAIFNMYGHLGGWENVKSVSSATRDAFVTSPYFKADGDTKVFKLEQTGDDVGVLRWVNTSESEFLANANVNQIFTINSTESNWYPKGSDFNFTVVTPNKAVINTVVDSQTVTKNASGFTMLNVKFNGSGSVDTLKVKRLGFGDNTDYDNDGVYLYKDGIRLTNVKSFNSDRIATFSNLKLQAPFVLSVVADFSDEPKTGHTAQVELQGDYTGLPLKSNTFAFAAAESGNVTFVKAGGTLEAIKVGQKNAQVSEFKATVDASSEDITIRHLELFNAGDSVLTNVKLSDGITTWAGTISGDRLVFNPEVVIKSSKVKTFKVYADILGDDNDTVKLYIENPYDVYATGNIYGFGVMIVNDSFNQESESHQLTLTEVEGNITTSSVSGDKVIALWGDTGKTLFQFKAKATDESFVLDNLTFSGFDEDAVKKIYVYSDNTLVGSESIDGSVATVSSDFVLTGEKTFTVKADFNDLDASVSEDFTPSLTKVEATGVSSDKEKTSNTVIAGKEVNVYSAYPTVARVDNFSSNLPLVNTDVLKLSVLAVGGDIKLASASAPFKFTVNSYGMPNEVPYKVTVGGVEYSSGNWASTSSTFVPLISNSGEELLITEGSTKEITFRFNFAGADSNRGFQLTLDNANGNIVWFAEDKDGNFKQVSSKIDTLDLPIEGVQMYHESN